MYYNVITNLKKEQTMISKAMQDAINDQINKEMFSSYLYLSMAAYFEDINLPGAATGCTSRLKKRTNTL